MSAEPQGPGWWLASDGRYYPPTPPDVRAGSTTRDSRRFTLLGPLLLIAIPPFVVLLLSLLPFPPIVQLVVPLWLASLAVSAVGVLWLIVRVARASSSSRT